MFPIEIVTSLVGKAIDRFIPDPAIAAQAKADMMKAENAQEMQAMATDLAMAVGQLEINKIEATGNGFKANWRPMVGWICAAGFGYTILVEPFSRFVATVLLHYSGQYPVIDTTLMLQVLLGMLGMGGLRTFEKLKGLTK